MRRDSILNGELTFPKQIMEIILNHQELDEDSADNLKLIITEFWDNIWYNFLKEKSCSTTVWYDRFEDKTLFNVPIAWNTYNSVALYTKLKPFNVSS